MNIVLTVDIWHKRCKIGSKLTLIHFAKKTQNSKKNKKRKKTTIIPKFFYPPQIAIEEFARLFLERCLPEFVGLFPFFKACLDI